MNELDTAHADDLLDAIGDLYGNGDIRFGADLERARRQAVEALQALTADRDHWHEEYLAACKSLTKRVHQGADAVRRLKECQERANAAEIEISRLRERNIRLMELASRGDE